VPTIVTLQTRRQYANETSACRPRERQNQV